MATKKPVPTMGDGLLSDLSPEQRAVVEATAEMVAATTVQPVPPKKPSRWSKCLAAIGNAIGNAKFGG